MHMIVRQNKPYVASQDLTVFVEVLVNNNGTFDIPYMKEDVKPLSMVKADGVTLFAPDGDFNVITTGFIPAKAFFCPQCISDRICRVELVEAVIPKGTEYCVSEDMSEVCAKEMYVTDKFITECEPAYLLRERLMDLYHPLFLELDNTAKPKRGYAYCSDGKVYHPHSIPCNADVDGFVLKYVYNLEKGRYSPLVRMLNGIEK